jgi:predicted nuclease of predicted toxin-antitoxin system
VKILADQHISPRTVEFLKSLGHDAVRVSERLPRNAPDSAILALALAEGRVVLSQDLDFTGLIATSGNNAPSLIVLRLGSPNVVHVNEVLQAILPKVDEAVRAGAIVSVDDRRFRVRRLPIQ